MFGKLLRYGSIAVWILRIVACMGACLGCAIKPKLISSANGPLERRNPQAQRATEESIPNVSERFWTSSICEMDNSTILSQGSMSSVSTSTQMHDTHCSSSSNTPSEFVNHGLLLWRQTRQQWIGNGKPEKRSQKLPEPRLSWNATYDSLLGSNKPFPKPIPLPEMVDFLVDIWEQEGMYD
ncbi:hypothetical protein M9H77_29285 [Catharanthus roseus]|uniref:Uncharacterized protein n=1 Tax=Catharanthus roseus TaxID=4058 RepID=A0ACC0AHQ7_CATRO|nr:hypothetical protein M9H77_29285 [Catharanthus roseus]